MAPHHEQPGLEVGVQPNDKFIPGSLGGIQGYSTAAMANTSTNLHPATEGHALHLANEGNSSDNPFSNSADIVSNSPPNSEQFGSPHYSSSQVPQASSISPSTAGRASPSNYSLSNTPQPSSISPPAQERSAYFGYTTAAQNTHNSPLNVNRDVLSDFSRSNSANSRNRVQAPQKIDAGYGYAPSKYSPVPGYYKTYDGREKGGKHICGLKLATFLWLLAFAIVILVAGLGLGLGLPMAVNNAKKEAAASASAVAASASAAYLKQNASPTSNVPMPTAGQATAGVTSIVTSMITASAKPTTTSSGPYTADPSPSTIARDCTSPKKFTIGGKYENTFSITCNKDFVPPSVGFVDIIALTVYSINDCARACASYNRNIGGGNKCIAAAFDANWAAVGKDAGNCWLKNTTATIKDGAGTQAVILLEA
ncbi:hypothetical protein HYFRA_00010028 [Hymenoscyphus fraxineus]|uniref:Apple domain-containing protein n=1 Tax=Hymenoscyphus fraxineus TaxID=746836 RepID=A0A9N9PRX5_9HELO|nr:hypothetical protein HYFRA_00010028 [Hymenoscyphus fraxineus]